MIVESRVEFKGFIVPPEFVVTAASTAPPTVATARVLMTMRIASLSIVCGGGSTGGAN
jgi:hypothetical protein